jgi:uncharacterized protein YgiM (DUF1202 family)
MKKGWLLLFLLAFFTIPVAAQQVDDGTPVSPPPQYATDAVFAVVTVPRANVRAYPDVDLGGVITVVTLGQRFSVLATNEDESWYLIDLGYTSGWIFGGIVLVANPDDIAIRPGDDENLAACASASTIFAPGTGVNAAGVEVRFGPGVGTIIIQRLPLGSPVEIVARSYPGTWVFVNYGASGSGWVNVFNIAFPEGCQLFRLPVR